MKYYSKYERRDPWQNYPWADEPTKISKLEAYLWWFSTGFFVAVTLLVLNWW